tara:strand:+ start:4705 stop:5040 length:336 start_codon:yes stop_codon:yes gene_type:complete
MDNSGGVGQSKKIIFEDTDKRHADLKIRLHYDQLKQGEFFRLMLSGYVDQDERIMSYVEDYKKGNSIQSKKKIADSKRMRNKAQLVKDKFALSTDEVESIFDLLEEENPDL